MPPLSPASGRQTDLGDFLLDILDFIEEKINEALSHPASQFAAIGEAAGAIPLIRDRLREDEVKWTQFVLVLGTKIETDWWQDWWRDFAKIERADFVREASDLICETGAVHALFG
jgi:hypothetical protein